jgi:hypothetical protein
MPADTHETAPNQFVRAGEVQFAYRRAASGHASGALQLSGCKHG